MAQAEHAKQRRDMIMKQSQQSQQIDSLQLQHDFDIRIGHIKIINANHCRYLGVYIDKDLKWIEHINQLYNKLQKYAGIFIGLDKGCLINVLRVFILPLSIRVCSMALKFMQIQDRPICRNSLL